MRRIRVLLADDHSDLLNNIRSLLEPDFEVVGAVADGNELILAADILHPDVIVTDIGMPRMNGIVASERILSTTSSQRILFLTMHNDPSLIQAGMSVGAMGCVLKHFAGDELAYAIRETYEGRHYLSPKLKGQ
jgi:DNA-binding NarL/FixJ family response regulator